MKKTEKKGFSLVELLVVVAIMAVLVSVLAPTLTRYVELSRQRKDEDAMAELERAVLLAMHFDPVYGEVSNNLNDDGCLVVTFKPDAEGIVVFADADNMQHELLKETVNVVGESYKYSSKKYRSGEHDFVVTIDMKFPYAKVTSEWK